jgi:hypothetical protein
MHSFLEEVANQSLQTHSRIEDLVYILPSKRAGNFLKSIIARKVSGASFAPAVYSIETFVERLSGLQFATNTKALFELYQAYLDTDPEEADSFYAFTQWGQTLLQDYNEIDRYLVPSEKLFSYLADVKKIEHWTGQAGKTPLMERYLQFWNTLEPIYIAFRNRLREQDLGYQGMVYREACNHIGAYLESAADKTHIFLGFNALNTAESTIIQRILDNGNSEIYWDVDQYFLDDPVHDAGYFIRQHLKTWPYLAKNPLKGASRQYKTSKKVTIAAIPKNVTQAKYVGHLLQTIDEKRKGELENTAVVLGDENLLNPVLHSIPRHIPSINITMGYPLEHSPLEGLFSAFFELYLQQGATGWFYKNVLTLLAHPYIDPLFSVDGLNYSNVLQSVIKDENWLHVGPSQILSVPDVPQNAVRLLFFDKPAVPRTFISRCRQLIIALKDNIGAGSQNVFLEQLYRFHVLFNQLDDNVREYPFVTDLKSLYSLFRMLLVSETVDFRGEPMEGLQLMGMLESRNLDFDTIILTSVNEGILPSGKSNNSFIPHDLKKEFGLPTFKEKDAVYTYHFYRLIQRAKEVYLLYNTEPDVLEGGEKSRLISQLLSDPEHEWEIKTLTATPRIESRAPEPETVYKDEDIMAKLREKALQGFSPTSISRYIKNPIEFYKKSVLGIDDNLEVDESITSKVFGTVIHGVLEDLYQPFVGHYLDAVLLQERRGATRQLVQKHFSRAYAWSDLEKGRNLIANEVLVRYIERLIDREISALTHHKIKLIGLERKVKTAIEVPGLDFPVYLHGVIDRIDEVDGQVRIIDYKTGDVQPRNVEITDWEGLITDSDHNTAFQLLCYACLFAAESGTHSIQAGIISIRNLNAGTMHFAIKETRRMSDKDSYITSEVLHTFRTYLCQLLSQLFDPALPFVAKEP